MKLWEKGIEIDQLIESFTISKDRNLDLLLAEADIQGSKAHADMLASVGLITAEENIQIQEVLDSLSAKASRGEFVIEEGVEDVHSQVEFTLTKQLGNTGKKIHLGRSRNDQVLVDLRLFFRNCLDNIIERTGDLVKRLLEMAEKNQDILMPGYTHMQMAMPSSFGMWFGGYAEALTDDIEYFAGVRHLINRNPLGTAAGYGSSMPIDRDMTTKALDFEGLCINPINAQIGRGKTEYILSNTLATASITISKLAMDICLFSSQQYGFIELPDHLTTGSSIMPHKKNPDVFEIIRARANLLISLPVQIGQVINSLPSGYHRDYQVLKEVLFPALESYKEIIELLIHCIPQIEILPIDLSEERYKYLFSVEKVNQYVSEGHSFREAYKMVASEIADDSFIPPMELNHTHIGSLGNLGLERIASRCTYILEGNRRKYE